ncbi:MAG: lipoyl(octanoyl) transferase LipB [Phycisphaerales bacterium]|nr:lipoyl(octanoyl) transferase LipB [Phycisphaerales bacterium]
MTEAPLRIIDLGRLAYQPAYDRQIQEVERVLADRAAPDSTPVGTLLLVEHDPVITMTPRPGVESHLLASPELLARSGVTVARTDRGGDITYHGPGQLVVYPILDLNRLNLGLHAYMRLLEQAVIDYCASLGFEARRDPAATGAWVNPGTPGTSVISFGEPGRAAKLCAMGVRIRKWVTFHGLALNVTTNLEHFRLIIPCGLAGRPITSLLQLLGPRCPTMDEARAGLSQSLERLIATAQQNARADRARA